MNSLLGPAITSFRLLSSPDKAVYVLFLLARVATNLLDVVGIAGVALFGTMLASGLTERSEASLGSITVSLENPVIYLWVISGVVLIFLTKSTVAVLLLRANGLFLARIEAQAALEVVKYFYGEDLSRVKSFSEARIQYTAATSTSMAFANILANLNVLFTESSLFLFVFIAFGFTNWTTAAVVALYFFILIGGFQWLISKRLKSVGFTMAEASKRVFSTLREVNSAYRELVVGSSLEGFLARFNNFRVIEARTFARLRFFEGSPRFFIESALMVGLLGLVGWQFFQDSLSEGLVVTAVFMSGGVRMMGALLPLQNALTWLRMYGPQARDCHEVLGAIGHDLPPKKTSPSDHPIKIEPATRSSDLIDRRKSPTGAVEVTMSAVSFAYGDSNAPALKNIDLEIERGSVTAIVGPSGAGKTTIADLIVGLLRPSMGKVCLDGLSPEQFRDQFPKSLAYVPQRPGIISGSIAENVALGFEKSRINEEQVLKCLESVGLLEVVQEKGGVDSDVGVQLDALSGGQLQRLGLARAFYSSPRLILLDEATSALDAGSESEIIKYVESFRGVSTVIIIAHRLSTIKHADKVVVVDNGEIEGQGTFDEVRKAIPLIESYVQLMSFE